VLKNATRVLGEIAVNASVAALKVLTPFEGKLDGLLSSKGLHNHIPLTGVPGISHRKAQAVQFARNRFDDLSYGAFLTADELHGPPALRDNKMLGIDVFDSFQGIHDPSRQRRDDIINVGREKHARVKAWEHGRPLLEISILNQIRCTESK
jgi:hypothetical protein